MTVLPSPGTSAGTASRTRTDRCPGVLAPWYAADGALLRIRLVGGQLTPARLDGLGRLADEHGDGDLHLTSRANIQVRGVAVPVPLAVVDAVAALGLLPSPAHERVRNIVVSPLTGRLGGRADLRPLAHRLDAALLADPALAGLPARFLFCLDDRGDLPHRTADLAAVAHDVRRVRLWAGGLAGPVVALAEAADRLVDLARDFLRLRGTGPTAPWHVTELAGGGAALGPFAEEPPSPTAPVPPTPAPAHGRLRLDDGRPGEHLPVPEGRLTPALRARVLAALTSRDGTPGPAAEVVVTPWRSLVLCGGSVPA